MSMSKDSTQAGAIPAPVAAKKPFKPSLLSRESWSQGRGGIQMVAPSMKSDAPALQFEDLPVGYPRFSALMASQPSYIISRRFTNARVRLLLYKQDEIAVLEEKLASIDNSEPREQFLGSRRRDVNTERKETMRDLGKLLAEYDDQVSRLRAVMDMENPKAKDVESVRDWVQDTGAIARVETAFLTRPGAEADLMNVADVSETAHVTSVEPHVEEPSVAAYVPSGGLSRGDHIFSGETVRRLGRSINIWFSAPLLIAPIVGLYTLQSTALRSTVTVLFVAAFGISASSLGNVKTPEISLATAAYLAVFAVLVSVAGSK